MSQQNDDKLSKLSEDQLNLWKLRHTAEHVLHQAIKQLYPSIHLAMGPATEEGFYFDFDSSPNNKEAVQITEQDFPKIEARMQELIKKDLPLIKKEISVKEAREIFSDNPYKLEWIDLIEKRGEKVTVYWTGEPNQPDSMVDLCSGPHADSTGKIKAFKLLSVAGAYWHGDEKKKMLTRVYGTAFASQEELDQYLNNQEEAKRRDHKKLGKELDLFTFSDLVGAGLPLWTPRGALIRNILDNYVWQLRQEKSYQKVEIPHITKKDLYEVSGHWDKFKDELFKITTREGHEFAMKPMNCPHHTQIFARKLHSYKEMPQRYANTTMVYRDEQTGELSGLSRVRSITQDDAHVFCRYSQIQDEMNAVWDIIDDFYGPIGFDFKVRLSLHDPKNMGNYLGDAKEWQQAESLLRELAKKRGVAVFDGVGEAAFYGPKLDFIAKDSLGREWQIATIQLDMNMPKSFELYCMNEEGEHEGIYMIHCAVMGSIERYVSILIEHFAGAFPTWLSPVQVSILPINDKVSDYANKLLKLLETANIRAEVNAEDSLGKRIRYSELQKIPYMLIVGEKEASQDSVSVRSRGEKDLGNMLVPEFIKQITKKIEEKSLTC